MKRTIFRLLSRLGIAALSTSAMAQVAPPVSNGPKTGTTIAADLLAEAAALGFKLEVSGSGPDVLVLHGGAGPASMRTV